MALRHRILYPSQRCAAAPTRSEKGGGAILLVVVAIQDQGPATAAYYSLLVLQVVRRFDSPAVSVAELAEIRTLTHVPPS